MRKYKCHTLYIVAIVILFILITISNSSIGSNNNNVSALSYSSSVGVGFTFNPTLSINISSSDLVISNLKPGTTEDSNSINVSVATNAAYGYTLSANVGDDIHNNTNLTHTNNTDIFSSIAIDADLASLDTDNTWGYTSKLSNKTTWNNYNGLSSSSNAILLDNSNAADSTGGIDFKIAAKAGNTQPNGEYTGTINFITITKVAPMSLLDSFIASGAEQLNGYYKMQDMTHDICSNVDIEESELQLIDVRDNKIYWVAKLKDGNCWMTQNLDLDILAGSTNFTSDNTDLSTDINTYTENSTLGAYALKGSNNYGYIISVDNDSAIVTWVPERTTVTSNNLNRNTWAESNSRPYSYDKLESDGTLYYPPDDMIDKNTAGNHALSGNYYNWTAAIASNDSGSLVNSTFNNISNNPRNSICPKGWRLPTASNAANNVAGSTNEFGRINFLYNESSASSIANLTKSPLWFIRSGSVYGGKLNNTGSNGYYWSSTVGSSSVASYDFYFNANYVNPIYANTKRDGFSVRCLAK